MSDIQDLVFAAVRAERDRQDAKYGGPQHDNGHSWADWMSFIKERVPEDPTEAQETISDEDSKKALLQIAALAIAALETRARRTVYTDLR